MPYITDVDGYNELDLLAGDCDSLTATTSDATGDENKPVKVTGALKWGLLAANDDIGGIVRKIERTNEVCAVQVHGVATLAYTGSAPTVGWGTLISSATIGSVKAGTPAAGSPLQEILEVDTVAKTVTFRMQ